VPIGRIILARRNLVIIGLFFVFGLACSFFPFLRAIDYPLALVATPFASVVFLLAGVLLRTESSQVRAVAEGWLVAVVANMALLVPLSVASVLSSVVCEPLYGLLFILAGPLASASVSYPVGMVIGKLLNRWWAAVLVSLSLVPGSAAIALLEFLATPRIRFYGTFYGLYHGAVYDEAVFVDMPYLWLRVWNAAAVAFLLLLLWRNGRRWVRVAGMAAASALFLAITIVSPHLRFVSSYAPLDSCLYERTETERFVLKYSPEGRAADVAGLLAEDLEFRAHQIERLFGLDRPREKIFVYLYDSAFRKQELMGAGRTSIAKPWLKELHVHDHTIGSSVAAHELAHVMLADISDSVLGLPVTFPGIPRPGIMEGAAVAVERGGSLLTTHQWAAAMDRLDKQPDMKRILEGVGFWSLSSTLAYTACGSFVRYLLEQHGYRPFAALYAGAGFEESYGIPLDKLLADWNAHLDALLVGEEELELARFVFSRPPVFEKTCPYAGGRCLQQALRSISEPHSRRAAPLARRALSMTHDDIFLGQRFVRLLYAVREFDEGILLSQRLRETCDERGGGGAAAEAAVMLSLADGLWLAGEDEPAQEIFESLANTTSGRWLSTGLAFRRRLVVRGLPLEFRRVAVGAYISAEAESLFDILLASREAQVTGAAGASPVSGIRLALAASYFPDYFDKAIELLEAGLERMPPGHDDIRIEAQFALSRLYYLSDRNSDAGRTLTRLQTEPLSPVERESCDDWLERVRWKEALR